MKFSFGYLQVLVAARAAERAQKGRVQIPQPHLFDSVCQLNWSGPLLWATWELDPEPSLPAFDRPATMLD